MIQAEGKVKIFRDGSVKILVARDILFLYKWFISRRFFGGILLNTPKHGAHITVVSAVHHKSADLSKVRAWDGKKVKFFYDPYIHIGGRTTAKGWRNFYLKVACEAAENIKKQAKAIDKGRFLGYHITIANTKGLYHKEK